MFSHKCIKKECVNSYEDTDPDAYYCPSCVEEKQKIAKEIDAKMGSRGTKHVVSALQEYDNAPKVRGFMQVRL